MSGFVTPPRSPRRSAGPTGARGSRSPWATMATPSPPAPVVATTRTVRPVAAGASTPRLLGWWRAGLAVICLVAAVFAPGVLRTTNTSLLQAEQATTMTMHLTQARGDLLNADAAAVAALVDADASGFSSSAGSAARALTAAADIVADEPAGTSERLDAVAQISAQVVEYTAQMSAAGTDSARVAEASDALRNDVLPVLDELITAQQHDVAAAQGGQNWLVVVWLAAVALVILAASISVASRTRRVLNLGLVAALAATGLGIWQSVTLVNALSNDVATTTIAVTDHAVEAWDAIAEAKDISARTAAGLTVPDSPTFSEQITRITDAQQYLDPGNDQITTAVTTITDQHAAGQDSIALAGDPYPTLQAWAQDWVTSSHTQLDQTLTQRAQSVNQQALLVAGLMVVAAISGVVGLSQSMRRYQ